MSNPLLKFEHHVLARARQLDPGRGWLVACSGGLDSMVLAEFARRWRRRLTDRLIIAHVHHGRGPKYRDRAQDLVRRWARAHHLPFVTNQPGLAADGGGEAGLRDLRYGHLERWRRKYRCDVIVLAHHRDDLLETRLLRLIRGTGPLGLTAMRPHLGARFRPLLEASRAELEAYARGRDLRWCEDPSNSAPASGLRAWVRHEWLPALECRAPGAGRGLARSLALLGGAQAGAAGEVAAVRRAAFAALDAAARERVVHDYLRALGARDFGLTHVREVVKRLDTRRKEFSFSVLGLKFAVADQFWWASRVCEKPTPC